MFVVQAALSEEFALTSGGQPAPPESTIEPALHLLANSYLSLGTCALSLVRTTPSPLDSH